MAITVKFFASLREDVGKSSVQLPAPKPLTVKEVWEEVCYDLPLPNRILIAVNMQYVDEKTLVKEGDEVAFFPPVTGG